MNFSSAFLFLVLCLISGSCEKCSPALNDAFKKAFNISDVCADCVVLSPGIFFREDHWAGFCIGNKYFLLKNWKCRTDYELLKTSESVALATNEFCEFIKGYDLDIQCLTKFNTQICSGFTEGNSVRKQDTEKKIKLDLMKLMMENNSSTTVFQSLLRRGSSLTETSSTMTTKRSSKKSTTPESTSSTSTTPESTSTTSTTTESTSTTSTTPESTSTTSTTTESSSTTSTTPESTSTTSTTTESTSTTSTTPESTSTTSTTPESTSTTSTTPESTSTKSTTTKSTSTTSTTTESTSTTSTAVESTSTRSTLVTTKSTKITSLSTEFDSTVTRNTITLPETSFYFSTESEHLVKQKCEKNEFFFKGHCYFLKLWKNFDGRKHNIKIQRRNVTEKTLPLFINSTEICQSQHPKALGLAVETEEENKIVLDFLKLFYCPHSSSFLTSGVRAYGKPDEWLGWNLNINQSILKLSENYYDSKDGLNYCIDACKSRWFLFNFKNSNTWLKNFFVICERPYNPKNIQPELHESCLRQYRNSSCYSLKKHSNYCCEKDETGEIWFACPSKTHIKLYQENFECSWTCKSNGFFIKDRPKCKGRLSCNDSYNSIRYIAPISRYAIGDCPRYYSGYSTWYCNGNRTFLKTPNYSLCCKDSELLCRDTDPFLNIWMGCPARKIIKKTACPPGSILKEAVAEWYCQKNGLFNGTAPNYFNCNVSKIDCSEKDRYGREWAATAETTAIKNCPPFFTGQCFWKCTTSGKFDGPEPDCFKCKAPWMDEIEDKIKNNFNHKEIMNILENYTRQEDLRIGSEHVLKLTADCVALFKKQNPNNEFDRLDEFLRSYSKILKNIAGDPKLWSSFSVSNREKYSEQIIQITQNAAFANLDSKNVSRPTYNVTLTKSEEDGFEFFVAYNPSLGLHFPLENISESSWKLDLKEINVSESFAAMGLAINYSLSSLMFPQGNKTENLELNSPAVTFAVASSKDGKPVDANVVVSISFKHKNRTRLPQTNIIKRKLHKGEKPSGVFNSTLCYYYRKSVWSTKGCTVTYTSKDLTNCTCTHLSTIGLLMSIHQYKPNESLELVSIISSGVTIISLVATLLVFYFFDTVKNDRVFIGKNLCVCLLIGHILLITVMDKKFFNIPDNLCMVYAILLHYVFMAAFAWMFVEGCHLYRMLVLVFDSDIEYRWVYLMIGYGAPFIIVLVTKIIGYILQEQPYGQDEMCWLKPPNFVWAFVGPVFVSTSINFCILITSMKLAISAKRRTEKTSLATLKLWIKGWISLSTLLGITWLFGLAYVHYDEPFVYAFVTFNGLQGFFIFIFRCVLCEQYKAIFLKKTKFWFSKLKLKSLKKSENIKSEKKFYVTSATKSSSVELEGKNSGYDLGINKSQKSKKLNTKVNNSFHLKSEKGKKLAENSSAVDIDVNITLQPALSEAYLRNRMIAKNFSVRKSKAKWLAESDNFSELSFCNIYHPN